MNVFLDDVRLGPHYYDGCGDDWDSWVIVRGIDNVKCLLTLGVVDNMSLDHDLGNDQPTGYDLLKWMADTSNWPKGHIWVHSQNPVGAKNMAEFIERYKPQ